MPENSADPTRATQAELARLTGTSRQAIHDLIKRNIIPVDPDGLIDVAQARAAILAAVRPSAKTAQAAAAVTEPTAPDPAATDAAGATSYHLAKTMREAAEAQIAALKLAELRGDLIRIAAVRTVWTQAYATLREAIRNLSARLAPQLAIETDPAQIQNLLDAELHQALTAIANARLTSDSADPADDSP